MTHFHSAYHFPHPAQADPEGHGIIAVGGDLQPQTLLHAYSTGLFPWFSEGEPIAWWSPEPRCVLYPEDFSVKKSLKKSIRKSGYWLSVNHAFAEVMTICAHTRAEGTWITDDMIAAYCTLHGMGYAHSVEVWSNAENPAHAQLIGGLYGIKIGAGFFGESMFHKRTDASKMAFAFLVALAKQSDIRLIDCQVESPHLASLGAVSIRRQTFLNTLAEIIPKPTANWQTLAQHSTYFSVTSLLDTDYVYLPNN